MQPIPYVSQENIDFCGPAVLQMTLAAFGIAANQEELAHRAQTPREPDYGTSPEKMLDVLLQYGIDARAHEHATMEEIREAHSAGSIVLICYTEPSDESGHYAIVESVTDSTVVLIDPEETHGPHFAMPRETFLARWRDPQFTKTEQWALFASARAA